jgi:negative regulator of flagellin synthesis FlgM
MRINDMRIGLYSYQNQVNRSNVKDAKKTSSSDAVQISTKGQELSQALKSDQIDRQNKVQQLKQQIAEGSYKVDANKIAAKMMDFWKR